jgi:hypothetical protein
LARQLAGDTQPGQRRILSDSAAQKDADINLHDHAGKGGAMRRPKVEAIRQGKRGVSRFVRDSCAGV